MKRVGLLAVLLFSCHSPRLSAKETSLMTEADKLFKAGRYDAALAKYDASLGAGEDERAHTRALFGAIECETLLGRHEHALDRVRAAKLPSDPGLKAIVELTRLEMFSAVRDWYGFSDETEEGAEGSAKLSKASVDRQQEADADALWRDREKLARLPLSSYGEGLELANFDRERYPSVWDFAVLRLANWLAQKSNVKSDPTRFAVEDFPRDFAASLPALERTAALYEESGRLPGGPVDRAVAAERWRVQRVGLGGGALSSPKQHEAWREAAVARQRSWAARLHTPLGRAAAASEAAKLLYDTRRKEALALIDAALPRTPESDVAVELRALRHRILDKEIAASARVTRDGKGALSVTSRNLAALYVRLYAVDLRDNHGEFWTQTLSSPSYETVEAWLASKKSDSEWSAKTGDKGDYMETTQRLDVKASGVGLYLAVVSGDATFTPRKSILRAAYVNITDVAVARAESDAGMRYYAFSADTGAPLANVPFNQIYSSDWRTRNRDVTTTNQEGVGVWKYPGADYLQIDALAVHGGAVAMFESPAYHGRRTPSPPVSLMLLTDRPIYRPGQTMKVRVTSVARVNGSFKVDAGRKVRLALNDPNGKEVAHADLVTGPMGSASTELALPQKGILGAFGLVATPEGVRDVRRWQSVRVEEYKRPEFEVTLEAPKGASRYGDKTAMKGAVKYYFGGAAGDVPVKWKVSRRRFFPFWYWRPVSSPTVELARGQLKTDKSGNFSVEFTAAPDPDSVPSDNPDFVDISDYIVEVEAHDAGGRTIQAERSVRVGARSFTVNAEAAAGFFFSDEKPALKLRAQNLEDQPIAATVDWQLERLGAPKATLETLDQALLQVVLKNYSTRDADVAHGSVSLDGKTPGALVLPALAAGGYRLRMTSGDARASFAFLVVDSKTRALPGLPLPTTMLLRKDGLGRGERAEVLVGASTSSGAYHLEQWQNDRLISHRLERGAPVRVWTIDIGDRETGGFSARFIGARGVGVVGGDLDVAVPRKDKLLDVKLVSKPASLEPGQSAKLAVEVKDQKGRPVDGEMLVTIYDRSLELYASGTGNWGGLWNAPSSPPPRAHGATDGYGVQLPGDEAAARAAAREIEGKYKARNVPRFSWERTSDGFGGGRLRPMMMEAAPDGAFVAGAAPAPSPRVTTKKMAGARGARANDGDGVPDRADKDQGGGQDARKQPPPPGDLRTNMAETAAWVPSLRLTGGKGTFDVVAPERLTSWRVALFALGRGAEIGRGGDTFATQKPLMVRVEIPRFLREGDRSTVTAVVHNETDKPVAADVAFEIVDDVTQKSRLADLGVKNDKAHVEVPAHGLVPVELPIVAPENIATYKIRAHVQAGKLADAEERPLPILPSRERLLQSRVVALSGNDKKLIEFAELARKSDASLRSESLTVSIDPELALSVLRSIPFLVEYPYECTEQTLNRFVPLAIVNKIYEQHPEIARAIAAAPHRQTANEPWDKDDPRRLLMLTETPWLAASEGGSKDARLRDLLNPALVGRMQSSALDKLRRAQNSSGAFTWFPGGKDDFYMTLYVLEQLALLEDFAIAPPRDMVTRAFSYVERELPLHVKKNELDVAYLAYASYVLTAFEPAHYPEAARARPLVQAWMKFILGNRQILTPYGRAWCARVMARLGDKKTALELLESALDGTKRDPVIGVYFTPERFSWRWYSDSVEKHAFFLRTLAALKPADERVPGMLQWLLFNRKGNEWHSTKASAAAVYSILDLMQKQGSLARPNTFHLSWDKEEELVTVKPTEDRQKPLSWTVRGRDVTPARGKVEVGKEGPGIAFASATWIYSSTKLQEAHASNLIAIERKYFSKVKRADGVHLVPLASGDKVHVGDEVEVRLTVKSKSQFEYVHVKEPRGAGFEETTLTSGWRWADVSAYEEPRDSLFNFFIDSMPHGEFTLQHSLRPTTPGTYRIGSAVLQSMYSPDVTAFSAGMELQVVR